MYYGQQKSSSEKEILKIYPNTIIARLPLLYGMPSNGLGFMNAWYQKLKAGDTIHCFTDEYRTTVSGFEAVSGIILLLNKKVNGIFHLGGKERMSRFEFAMTMAHHFDLDQNLIRPSLQSDVKMAAQRPADVSLASEKAFEMGYSPQSLKENLKLFKPI